MTSAANTAKRLRWLVGVHIVLAAAPLLGTQLEFSMWMLPVLWVLTSLPLGGLMTLSVWIGMGKTRLLWRLAIGLVVILYVSAVSFIVDFANAIESSSITEWIMTYLGVAGQFALLLFLLSGTFFLIGRWFAITLVAPDAGSPATDRFQFSMLQIMIVMSVVAIVLSLLRLARAASGHEPSTWELVTIYALMFVNFFLTTACAAFAALGTGKVKRNVVLVAAVSVALGAATAIAMHIEMESWWLFGGTMLIVIVPMLTVLVSLLVIRSCGYRLVRRGAVKD